VAFGGGFNRSTQHLLILLDWEVSDGGECADVLIHPRNVLSDMQLRRNASTCPASAGVFTRPRPKADMGRTEIPQCSRLVCAIVGGSTGGVGSAPIDSEQFRCGPRIFGPLFIRLSVR